MDSVFSGQLSVMDKSPGPGRKPLYSNIKLSVLGGHLSYVEDGHFFPKIGQLSLSLMDNAAILVRRQTAVWSV